jgi:hypothetical protein
MPAAASALRCSGAGLGSTVEHNFLLEQSKLFLNELGDEG